MERYFNITGSCNPEEHYMVNLDSRLKQVKTMIDKGQYFCINRGRQYGKTTLLKAIERYLKNEYIVLRMDFQHMDTDDFAGITPFVQAFSRELLRRYRRKLPDEIKKQLQIMRNGDAYKLADLMDCMSEWCENAQNPIVLIIDEVDSASNNQVFLDFLAQLRGNYLDRDIVPTFQSVILAGVHDIRNLRQKIRPDSEHKHNSPWNIASSFDVDMSFNVADIAGMLGEYEDDHHTGMDIDAISRLIYDYTSGYPVLVSSICKHMDEQHSWQESAVSEAVGILLKEDSALFDSLINKIEDNQDLYDYLYQILINGEDVSYNPDDSVIRLAKMYGFVKEKDGLVVIANRIFEMRLYNAILTSKKMQNTIMYRTGAVDKNQFISNGQLNMELVLEKFILHFNGHLRLESR